MTGRGREAGISHVEVLVASLLIAIALVPALDAVSIGVDSAGAQAAAVAGHYHLLGGIEEVLAEPFADLDAEALAVGDPAVPSAYSDAPGPTQRLVFLARYDGDDADGDGDPFTGGDPGLVWVRVGLAATGDSLETLTTP